VVSLNLCTDQLLLELLPRERIAMLSTIAADPLVSRHAPRARASTARSSASCN
jgi:iron complex transport system substrate-binding protein